MRRMLGVSLAAVILMALATTVSDAGYFGISRLGCFRSCCDDCCTEMQTYTVMKNLP